MQQQFPPTSLPTMTLKSPGEEDWGELGRRLPFLRRVPLFRGVSHTLLSAVATALKPLDVLTGGIVCRQGEPADQFFLIEEGTLAVTVDVGGRPRELARLGSGQFFGEMALLGQGRRTATVRAQTPAQLWTLSEVDFLELLRREPRLDAVIRETATARAAATERRVYEVEHRNLAVLAGERARLTIGRSPDNDLVFRSRLVSRHHAVVERSDDTFRLRDLGSANGTYIDGVRLQEATLTDGVEIWVGDERFVFDRREVQQVVEPRGIRVDISDVTTKVKGGKTLLHDIGLSILPGDLVAIVGGSGAGKTTLLDAISGVRPPTSGNVLYNGRDYYRNLAFYRKSLGYVPQDDIIHKELSVWMTLRYAAKLRLPPDTSDEDIEAAVDEALEALSLTAQADLQVGRLSGGQRKRASIGVELLTQPRIFFLDEPTSGLDPYTDAQMMQLMRRLADEGSTVLLTTHATKNVAICDKVIILTRGGYLAFAGTPHRALRYFETDAFDEIYGRLANEDTPEEWAQRFRSSEDYALLVAEQERSDPAEAEPVQRHSLGEGGGAPAALHQFGILWRRNFHLLTANPKALLPLYIMPFGMGALVFLVFKAGLFTTATDKPQGALALLFFIVLAAFFFGSSDGLDEIVSEAAIFRRERMVGLSIVPYVTAKIAVLAPIPLTQGTLLVMVIWLIQRLPQRGLAFYEPFVLTIWLTEFASLALALLASSLVSTSAQAVRLTPVLATPTLLLSGEFLPVRSMGIVGQALAQLSIAKWGFEAAGNIAKVNTQFAHSTSATGAAVAGGLLSEYGNTFGQSLALHWLVLGAFIVWPLVAACFVLKRKTASR